MALETFAPPSFLLSLIESTEQVIFAFDIAAKRIIYLNPAFEKVWHKKRKSVIANPDA